MLKTTWQL